MKHKASIHLTPSNPNYARERRRHLAGSTCWQEERR
jgi:hypothetical protein